MNRKYNLKLDLKFRCNNSIMKFNQFDNNTSDFFIKISNGGKSFDVEKAIVVLAIIKPSGKVASQFVEVENGLVYADLKSNMRDEIGTYTAKAMLILEDERVITDSISYEVEEDKIFSLLNDSVENTEDFTLLTDMLSRLSAIEISEEQRVINEAERILSEENRKIEEAKRVEAELIRQHEEADRAKYDATRESNENIRKQNESIRLANETNRIDEEAKRVEEEAKRVEAEQLRNANYNFMTEDEERRRSEANAHKEAEKLRVQAEANRVNEEAKRRTTEQARVSAENTRVSNENTRKANETTRQTNETHRVEAETQRQNRYNSFIADAEANANNFENYTNSAKIKEEERKSNELNRKSQEDRRVSNEVERISNENTRKANEKAREKNETSRQNIFKNKVDEVDTKISELNTTKDNFVSNISTKVDNKISELDTAKSDMTNAVSNKVNEVENRFNALTSKQQQDAEVIDARDGETSLKARLDRDIEKAKQVYMNVEGSHISTDSSVGYAKDIEILGNTIQNASNLADIRSVGDKVEGQELYEIPVLSRGKNLFNGVWGDGYLILEGSAMGTPSKNTSHKYSINFIKTKPNTTYKLSALNSMVGEVFFYRKNKTCIKHLAISSATLLTTDSDTHYIKFYFANAQVDTNSKFQLEEGTVATPYEPYQEDKLTILSPVQLEKVGDVSDRIIEKNGVWGIEKNVINYIFDTELINSSYKPSETNVQYYATIGLSDVIANQKTLNCISSTFRSIPLIQRGTNTDIACFMSGTTVGFSMPNTLFATITDFKATLPRNIQFKYVTTQPQFIPLPHDQQIKLRTFANKTNISFGCEIEGTIKAQVPKSLGATVNTHTEQINNLNKELDRVKKLEESTVSTVTTESDFTTVEATSNGYFEDVKLEGKTLVNLWDISKMRKASSISVSNNYVTVNADGSWIDCHPVYKAGTVPMLKPNTEYTVIAHIKNNTLSSYMSLNIDNVNRSPFTKNVMLEQGFTGYYICKLNTKTDLSKSDTSLRCQIGSGCTTGSIVFNCILLEGDHTQNPPSGYIEGLKSVGDGADEIVVLSTNNGNLAYNAVIEVGNLLANGSNGTRTDRERVKGFIEVEPNTSINISYNKAINVYEYDSNYDLIKVALVSGSLKLSQNTKFIRFYAEIGALTNIIVSYTSDFKNQPHKQDKKRLLYYNEETQTWEKPILREWDSIEKHANSKYYYHVRSKEGDYVEGDESLNDCITDLTVSVKKLAEEKVYECTNIDLITYANETNYIVECGAISPKTTLKVHNNISNVVSLLQKKVSLLESNITSYMITQNRLMLASRYNADTVSFKVDVATLRNSFEYDNDLYELILNNILVGKNNYNREYIENLTRFYWMDFVISDEMYSTLFEIIEEQHNPKVLEETPLI